MLYNFVFLIILAVMASKSKKALASGLLFGAIHAISSYFFFLTEPGLAYATVIGVSLSFFVVGSILGIGIAHLVVKQSQNWKYVTAMTLLSLATFLPSMFAPDLIAQF